MAEHYITYEQPLNDSIRVCLRLEHLFQLISHSLTQDSTTAARVALESMLEALNVIDRPDLKSKLTKALSSHASRLAQLENTPNIDNDKLHEILAELDQLIDCLYGNQDKIAHELRNNPFLSTIRQHMRNPGGACAFSVPAYHLWLKLPPDIRNEQLNRWYHEFDQLKHAVSLLLQLTRGSKELKAQTTTDGFYQLNLNTATDNQLVRVAVPIDAQVYPEISVGKHRLAIRFIDFHHEQRPSQSNQALEFQLACCHV